MARAKSVAAPPPPPAWDDAIRAAVSALDPKDAAAGFRVEIAVALHDRVSPRDVKLSVQGRRALLVTRGELPSLTVVALGPDELPAGKGRIRESHVSEWRGRVLAEFAL